MAGGHEHFDAVVVGSGFGGSVAAFRLADSGRRVCVLERGKAYPPGSFPRLPQDVAVNFWDPSEGRQGMFNFWSFRGIEALVASGLGGGSLIYANVLLRKDERWFVHEDPFDGGYETWPISRADLDPHYDNVESMMRVQRFPYKASPPYDLPKTAALKSAADAIGLEWDLPPLAVTFANPGRDPALGEPLADWEYPNMFGLPRRTCRLCGECDFGCNDGSKNTLDHTYLSAAKAAGCDIRTRSEVRTIAARRSGGYEIAYVTHTDEREGRSTATKRLPLTTVTADRLILAAGTLGSTYLLLRNRSNLPALSPALGSRFSGNGDLLSFARKAKWGRLDATRGPVITSYMRTPDGADPGGTGRGFYVEDAGFPNFIGWALESQPNVHRYLRALRFGLRWLVSRVRSDAPTDWSGAVADLLAGRHQATTSLPLLGMGRDVPDGQLRLRRDRLACTWTIDSSAPFFDRMTRTMRRVSDHLDATFKENPLSYFNRVITVHPLGGAPMGRHAGEGVVDDHGEVFGHPGLFVLDGAAMPGPVGPNPSLTIAAFSDLASERILETA